MARCCALYYRSSLLGTCLFLRNPHDFGRDLGPGLGRDDLPGLRFRCLLIVNAQSPSSGQSDGQLCRLKAKVNPRVEHSLHSLSRGNASGERGSGTLVPEAGAVGPCPPALWPLLPPIWPCRVVEFLLDAPSDHGGRADPISRLSDEVAQSDTRSRGNLSGSAGVGGRSGAAVVGAAPLMRCHFGAGCGALPVVLG
jgi:hypothetical protein